MAKVALSPRKSKRKSNPKNKQKSVYRIRNWSAYNESLKQRGSLTFWFDEVKFPRLSGQGVKQISIVQNYLDFDSPSMNAI